MLAKLRHLNLFYVQIMIEIKNKPKKNTCDNKKN